MTRRASPSAPEKANTALALLKSGNAQAAWDNVDSDLKTHPNHHALLHVAGLAALQLGRIDDAAVALSASLKQQPDQPGLWDIYGGVLEVLERYEDAIDAYTQASRISPDNAEPHRLRGAVLLILNQREDALEAFGKALELNPEDSDTLLQRAAVLSDLGAYESALTDYQHVLALQPTDPAVHRQLAAMLWEMQHVDQAETLFLKSLELDPSDAQTVANLAALYEQTNALEKAENFAGRALAIDSGNLLAKRVLATLARRSGDAATAIEDVKRFAAVATTPQDKEALEFELGRLNDELGDFDAAYAHFVAGNALKRDSSMGQTIDPQAYARSVAREAELLTASPPLPPPENDVRPSPPDPVFLIGFPRTGTTLLDQVLDSHPDIIVMDERPPLAEVHEKLSLLETQSGQPFVALDEEQRQAARQFYFASAEKFVGAHDGKVFVDKHPLSTARVRIIKLLFPQSRIIFALRHPCDVVLSCFMQRFALNEAMINFSTLDGAVNTYTAVMNLWLSARRTLKLSVHDIRYEDVVTDFDTQIGNVLEFLNVPWTDDVKDFHTHAQSRHVRTASSSQVTRPLYASSVARWHNYGRHLEPHMGALRPFIETFGYGTDIKEGI